MKAATVAFTIGTLLLNGCDEQVESEELAATELDHDDISIDEEQTDAEDGDDDVEPLELEDGTDVPAGEFDDITATPDIQDAQAPSCMYLSQWKDSLYVYAEVFNACSRAKRARIIWAHAGDGACEHYSVGELRIEKRYHRFRPDPYVTEVRKC